jgi:hypothetical protein
VNNDLSEAWPHFRETVFRFEARVDWTDYAIVTAANPSGKEAPPEVNSAQDLRLQVELESRGIEPVRVYGCSPNLNHEEPSWATPVSLEGAIALGTKFSQDAVFYDRSGKVRLDSCPPNRRASESLGRLKLVPDGAG